MKICLEAIAFDAGTQIRAAINEDVVTAYAERMSEGDVFPPVVLFHDGNQHYMADGFHRGLAAKRIGSVDIDADVQPGTMTDALWYALGANKANAFQLTKTDKKHAILLAVKAWPERTQTQIAEQIGCAQSYVSGIKAQIITTDNLPSRVTGKDGKSHPVSRLAARPTARETSPDRSPAAARQRQTRMREMAAEGYSSRQIAAELEMSTEGCRATMRQKGIAVPADRAVGKTKRHDANRIVSQMVLDAENLTADVKLIDFSAVDRRRLVGWIKSLSASRKSLDAFIRRLIKEQRKYEAT